MGFALDGTERDTELRMAVKEVKRIFATGAVEIYLLEKNGSPKYLRTVVPNRTELQGTRFQYIEHLRAAQIVLREIWRCAKQSAEGTVIRPILIDHVPGLKAEKSASGVTETSVCRWALRLPGNLPTPMKTNIFELVIRVIRDPKLFQNEHFYEQEADILRKREKKEED